MYANGNSHHWQLAIDTAHRQPQEFTVSLAPNLRWKEGLRSVHQKAKYGVAVTCCGARIAFGNTVVTTGADNGTGEYEDIGENE